MDTNTSITITEELFSLKENFIYSMENPAFYDAQIKKSILTTLTWYSHTPMEEISVVVKRGYVSLSGVVSWMHQKTTISSIIQKTKGVMGMVNNISVVNEFISAKT